MTTRQRDRRRGRRESEKFVETLFIYQENISHVYAEKKY